MSSILNAPETRVWDPDSRRGERGPGRSSLKRRDLWFFFGILAFMVLLFFVWQQHRGLRLADDVARLEARREAVGTRLVEMGVEVTRLRQPDFLFSKPLASQPEAKKPAANKPKASKPEAGESGESELAEGEIEGHIFVAAAPWVRAPEPARGQDRWLASVGLGVPQVLAADKP